MTGSIAIKNTRIYNRGEIIEGDILVDNGRISRLGGIVDIATKEIDGLGLITIPGIIDDQVHFREPGLTYKADIASESRAAVAGGITSFMEMPNTKPGALTQALLQNKYDIAKTSSYANYSFYMGASNDNLEEVLRTNSEDVCGVKIFMGSSTGNMLVDNTEVLDSLFRNVPMLIATHCEDENTIRTNMAKARESGNYLMSSMHPVIRNAEGCYISSSLAVELAKKHNTRLHILHISNACETELFDNSLPLIEKRITSELCVHHMYFDSRDYETLGNKIKCNPAIKDPSNKPELLKALLDDRLDVIATDHAPHTLAEKSRPYINAPSGLPLVQHSLNVMLDFYHRELIDLHTIVKKMSHAPAECFRVKDRGYLDPGYFADIALVSLDEEWKVNSENIAYKCGWSPFEGKEFKGKVKYTFVNGEQVYNDNQQKWKQGHGMRMQFI